MHCWRSSLFDNRSGSSRPRVGYVIMFITFIIITLDLNTNLNVCVLCRLRHDKQNPRLCVWRRQSLRRPSYSGSASHDSHSCVTQSDADGPCGFPRESLKPKSSIPPSPAARNGLKRTEYSSIGRSGWKFGLMTLDFEHRSTGQPLWHTSLRKARSFKYGVP
jgi:hypothetical protein